MAKIKEENEDTAASLLSNQEKKKLAKTCQAKNKRIGSYVRNTLAKNIEIYIKVD